MSKIHIIGATGLVGRRLTESLLKDLKVSPADVVLLASPRSGGKTIEIAGESFRLETTTKESLRGARLCLFNTETDVSSEFIPIALNEGAYVLDSSSHYRLNPEVPLVVPPVNAHLISTKNRLYAHANCIVSPIAVALAPLQKAFGIKRVVAATYQSTAGGGKVAIEECQKETKAWLLGEPYTREVFKKQIAFNLIPEIGSLGNDGYTSEEFKIIHEVKKILGHDLQITATSVRVPVLVGHSIALNIELGSEFQISEIEKLLRGAPAIRVLASSYATPIEVEGTHDVHVGRIRRDETLKNGLWLWLCSDNLLRGAARDAFEIALAIEQRIFGRFKDYRL